MNLCVVNTMKDFVWETFKCRFFDILCQLIYIFVSYNFRPSARASATRSVLSMRGNTALDDEDDDDEEVNKTNDTTA